MTACPAPASGGPLSSPLPPTHTPARLLTHPFRAFAIKHSHVVFAHRPPVDALPLSKRSTHAHACTERHMHQHKTHTYTLTHACNKVCACPRPRLERGPPFFPLSKICHAARRPMPLPPPHAFCPPTRTTTTLPTLCMPTTCLVPVLPPLLSHPQRHWFGLFHEKLVFSRSPCATHTPPCFPGPASPLRRHTRTHPLVFAHSSTSLLLAPCNIHLHTFSV